MQKLSCPPAAPPAADTPSNGSVIAMPCAACGALIIVPVRALGRVWDCAGVASFQQLIADVDDKDFRATARALTECQARLEESTWTIA